MNLFDRRSIARNNLIIIPHTQCSGNCAFCFLDKSKDTSHNIHGILDVVYSYLLPGKDLAEIFIHGGELFESRFLKESTYREDLISLLEIVHRLKPQNCVLSLPLSLENVSKDGIDFYLELRRRFLFRSNVAFSTARLTRGGWGNYLVNLATLSQHISSINVLVLPGNLDSSYIQELKALYPHIPIHYEEAMLLDISSSFSYNIKIPAFSDSIQCLSHCTDIITKDGIKNCMEISRRPPWVAEVEWQKLQKSSSYRLQGYQQVIDWYGCATCEKQGTCPGMCWISYYAQKELHNNRKCLYK